MRHKERRAGKETPRWLGDISTTFLGISIRHYRHGAQRPYGLQFQWSHAGGEERRRVGCVP